jgi:hypothetical protein
MRKNKAFLFSAIIALSLVSAEARDIPTPKMAVVLPATQDRDTKWVIAHTDGNEVSLLMELVPSGQRVESWDQLISNTVCFSCGMSQFLAEWKEKLESAGARIESSEVLPDKSVITVYKSLEENGIWRHMEGPDGIYGISYQTRPATENPERVRMWERLIREVRLDKNPKSNTLLGID